jgi:uncharacterized membrane protein
LEADQQLWRVGYFVHHYFHPNTPQLATQDIHGLTDQIGVSGAAHWATRL